MPAWRGTTDARNDHAVILLASHGSITAAAALDAAIDLAEELERAPQLTMLLRGMPHTVVSAVDIAKFQ